MSVKKSYKKITENKEKTGSNKLSGYAAKANATDKRSSEVVFDFGFKGGHLFQSEGEKIVRADKTLDRKCQALIIVSASGGARMQDT